SHRLLIRLQPAKGHSNTAIEHLFHGQAAEDHHQVYATALGTRLARHGMSEEELRMVPATGLEPVRCYSLEPESSASANSATRAQGNPHFFITHWARARQVQIT